MESLPASSADLVAFARAGHFREGGEEAEALHSLLVIGHGLLVVLRAEARHRRRIPALDEAEDPVEEIPQDTVPVGFLQSTVSD